MVRLHSRSPHKGKSASFHLHRTDGEGEWVLRAKDGDAVAEAGHAKADVAMRGTAEGLYWVLMGRGKPKSTASRCTAIRRSPPPSRSGFPDPRP